MNRLMMAFGIVCAILSLICLSKGWYGFCAIFALLSAVDVLGAFETEKRSKVAG